MQPICLDVTRTMSRLGAGPGTGIDRVERAWLVGLLRRGLDLTGLVRTTGDYRFLARPALQRLADGSLELPGRPDLIGRLSWRATPGRRLVETAIRAMSQGTDGTVAAAIYANVGHANLTARTMRLVSGRRSVVMLHDAIPLDLPDLHDPRTVRRSRAMLAAADAADLVLCPSRDAARRIAAHAPFLAARIEVLPLSIQTTDPAPVDLPAAPYFVSLGTIDARKNQRLLIDLWRTFAPHPPARLLLVGTPGRQDRDLARALRDLPDGVSVHTGLPDGQVTTLLAGATALLHPSRAEGFGLPPCEAKALGVPVIASDLAVYRETLGDAAVYLPPHALYQWRRAVLSLVGTAPPRRKAETSDWPSWDDHLDRALDLMARID